MMATVGGSTLRRDMHKQGKRRDIPGGKNAMKSMYAWLLRDTFAGIV